MAAVAPLLGPLLGLAGSFLGGGGKDKAPEPPAPIPPPAPPPPPEAPKGIDPQDTIAAEADRSRSLRRRKTESSNLTSINSTNTSSKTLLGE